MNYKRTLSKNLLERHLDFAEALHVFAVKSDCELYLVGGALRDIFYGESPTDFDYLINDNLELFLKFVGAETGAETLFYQQFLTGKILAGKQYPAVDCAQFRNDTYSAPGANPQVSPAKNLQKDLARRDFSINALALRVSQLPDFRQALLTGKGAERFLLAVNKQTIADLQARLLRVLHPKSFTEDPSRLLRLARYQVNLGAEVETKTAGYLQQIVESAEPIPRAAGYRIIQEFRRSVSSERSYAVYQNMKDRGILTKMNLPADLDEQSLSLLKDQLTHKLSYSGVTSAILSSFSDQSAGLQFKQLYN